MGTDAQGSVGTLPYPCAIKVHSSMCMELIKLVDRISNISPEIEATRPRCSSGIQALCLLSHAIEKTNLVLQHCSESSKLYLAITGNVIVSRCERSRNLLDQSLTEIQNNVPVLLAVKISRIIDDLRSVTFVLDSSEEEVGKSMRALLHQDASLSDSIQKSELEVLRIAASRLQIDSKKALVTETRSIKKLLGKVGDDDQGKKNILKYLLHLLKKHGKSMIGDPAENICRNDNHLHDEYVGMAYRVDSREDEAQADTLTRSTPPEEFKCPISSKLMFDPVVIASGQTFEKMWIQKWFDDGNFTCPKTQTKLVHLLLTPNTVMKDLISKWCMDHGVSIPNPCMQSSSVPSWETSSGSIVSIDSSMNILNLPIDVSNVSLGSLDTSCGSDMSQFKVADGFSLIPLQNSHRFQSCANTHEIDLKFLSGLASVPWESQIELVKDVEKHLKYANQACHSISSENFVQPLITFLKDAHWLCDVTAQKSGSQLLLTFLKESRTAITFLGDDAFSLLKSLLDTAAITEEVLAIMVLLSGYKLSRAKIAASGALFSILEILNSQTVEFHNASMKILYNMASDSEIRSHVASLQCTPNLVRFLTNSTLAKCCVAILKHLCDYKEARISITETPGCLASIAELLETGSREDQENALAILLSLCSQRIEYCKIIMDECVLLIPNLCNLSINGSDKGKAGATELLRLLRDITYSDAPEQPESDVNDLKDMSSHLKENVTSKSSGFFGRKFSFFTPKKKK